MTTEQGLLNNKNSSREKHLQVQELAQSKYKILEMVIQDQHDFLRLDSVNINLKVYS